jgi:hypothetical protein
MPRFAVMQLAPPKNLTPPCAPVLTVFICTNLDLRKPFRVILYLFAHQHALDPVRDKQSYLVAAVCKYILASKIV